MSGFGHSHSMFCLVLGACGLEFAQPRALLSRCFVLLHAVCVLSAACIRVMSCVNMWLMSIFISCVFMFYFAHGW